MAAQKLLSTVVRLGRLGGPSFGAGQPIDILLGRQTPKVLSYGHDKLSTFGVGSELREAEWRGVVRQLLATGLLAVKGEHGTLELTELSGEVLRGERKVMLRRDAPRPAAAAGGRGGAGRRDGPAARHRDPGDERTTSRRRRRRCSNGCAPGGRPAPKSRACRRT